MYKRQGTLTVRQCHGGDGGYPHDAVVLIKVSGVSLTAIAEVAHVALFRENFQEIQHIGVHLAPEAVVQNLAAFRLGQAGRGEQPDKFRLLAKAAAQSGQLPTDLLGEVFLPGKGVQGFAVNISHFRHTLSPNSSMKRSIISA